MANFNLGVVKAISIPGLGSIKKIQKGSTVLWASPTAYPYRQLEYIKFSGAEYINTGRLPSTSTCYCFDFTRTGMGSSSSSLAGNGVSAATQKGIEICRFTTTGGFTFSVGYGNGVKTSSSYVAADYLPTNARRTLWFANGSSLSLINIFNGTTRIGEDEFTHDSESVGTANLAVGSSSLSTTGYTMRMKLYGFKEMSYTVSAGSIINAGTVTHNWVPCQRKSDSVCGLYDTVSKVFKPLIGTTTGSAAAGTVVDEYPTALS